MKEHEAYFVDHIVSKLEYGGYLKRKPNNLDPRIAIDSEILLNFLRNTQSDSLKKLQDRYPLGLEKIIIESIVEELDSRGTLDVLRNGFRVFDIFFDCTFFKPVSTLNQTALEQYDKDSIGTKRLRYRSIPFESSGCIQGIRQSKVRIHRRS